MIVLQVYVYAIECCHRTSTYYFSAIYKFHRAIDVHSLIGYMGGYVGLLLGVSILQVPKMLWKMFDSVKRFYGDRQE